MTNHPSDSGSREEWRLETCSDCYQPRERAWALRLQRRGTPVPPGWQVTRGRGGGGWRAIARPTRFVTVCLCDT
ncbi:hypothetical protein [uncultured Pseudonocardia sp.]|uniref:hypothetical protein n=1 Tax=uncultured Pseudonocardia sp. TaxID=211455 RepID=UPI002609B1C8|nr:hypothetical protein [uncultured Pseudonocardia sp.]